jgi:uncharacterized phiE125 gp8 family phage protein
MNYNAIISVSDVSDESGVITEPVTLQEMKDYMRTGGFVDVDESTSDNISGGTFDDDLITEMITACRQLMEEKAGISIVSHTWEAVITNLCGMQEIPYGPVISITSLFDDEETEITSDNYKIVGNKWKYIKSPCYKNMVLTYTAGWDVLPKSIKLDLMRLVAYMYENRGEDQSIAKFASQLVKSYSRKTPIV